MKNKHWSSLLGTGVLLVAIRAAAVSVRLKQASEAPSANAHRPHSPSQGADGMIVMPDFYPYVHDWDTAPTSTTVDTSAVRRAQGLCDEYFEQVFLWRYWKKQVAYLRQTKGGPPYVPEGMRKMREADRRSSIVFWYLQHAYRNLTPNERRAFLERGDSLVVFHQSELVTIPTTPNRDSLLAAFDELLMPRDLSLTEPEPAQDPFATGFRHELVTRGLISAVKERP